MIRVDAVTANCAYVFSVSFLENRSNQSVPDPVERPVSFQHAQRRRRLRDRLGRQRRGARNEEGVVVFRRVFFPRE